MSSSSRIHKTLFQHRLPALLVALLSTVSLSLFIGSASTCQFLKVTYLDPHNPRSESGVTVFPIDIYNNNNNYYTIDNYNNHNDDDESSTDYISKSSSSSSSTWTRSSINIDSNTLRQDGNNNEIGIFCSNDYYSPSGDTLWILSQIFAIISFVLSSICFFLSWSLATILRPTHIHWKILTITSILAMAVHTPIFLLLDIKPCRNDDQDCNLSDGFYLLISSIIPLLVLAVFTHITPYPQWGDILNEWKVNQERMDALAGADDANMTNVSDDYLDLLPTTTMESSRRQWRRSRNSVTNTRRSSSSQYRLLRPLTLLRYWNSHFKSSVRKFLRLDTPLNHSIVELDTLDHNLDLESNRNNTRDVDHNHNTSQDIMNQTHTSSAMIPPHPYSQFDAAAATKNSNQRKLTLQHCLETSSDSSRLLLRLRPDGKPINEDDDRLSQHSFQVSLREYNIHNTTMDAHSSSSNADQLSVRSTKSASNHSLASSTPSLAYFLFNMEQSSQMDDEDNYYVPTTSRFPVQSLSSSIERVASSIRDRNYGLSYSCLDDHLDDDDDDEEEGEEEDRALLPGVLTFQTRSLLTGVIDDHDSNSINHSEFKSTHSEMSNIDMNYGYEGDGKNNNNQEYIFESIIFSQREEEAYNAVLAGANAAQESNHLLDTTPLLLPKENQDSQENDAEDDDNDDDDDDTTLTHSEFSSIQDELNVSNSEYYTTSDSDTNQEGSNYSASSSYCKRKRRSHHRRSSQKKLSTCSISSKTSLLDKTIHEETDMDIENENKVLSDDNHCKSKLSNQNLSSVMKMKTSTSKLKVMDDNFTSNNEAVNYVSSDDECNDETGSTHSRASRQKRFRQRPMRLSSFLHKPQASVPIVSPKNNDSDDDQDHIISYPIIEIPNPNKDGILLNTTCIIGEVYSDTENDNHNIQSQLLPKDTKANCTKPLTDSPACRSEQRRERRKKRQQIKQNKKINEKQKKEEEVLQTMTTLVDDDIMNRRILREASVIVQDYDPDEFSC